MEKKQAASTPKLFNIPVLTILIVLTLIAVSGYIGYLIGSRGTQTVVVDTITPSISQMPSSPDSKPSTGACATGGCSGEICAEASEVASIVTTCEFKDEYACFQYTKCERQANGVCGWTINQPYSQCLSEKRVNYQP